MGDGQWRPRVPLPDGHHRDQRGQDHDQDGGEPDVEDALDRALDRGQPRLPQSQEWNVTAFAEADTGRQQVVEAGGQMHPEPVSPGGGYQHEVPQGFPGQRVWRDDGILYLQAAGGLQ